MDEGDLLPTALASTDMAGAGEGQSVDFKAAWQALSEPLSWMHDNPFLKGYWGWGLADIANDLIDRAYPSLRPAAQQTNSQGQQAHPRPAGDFPCADISEVEPDGKCSPRNEADREGSISGQVGGRDAVLAGSMQCGQRNVRGQDVSEVTEGGEGVTPLAISPATNRMLEQAAKIAEGHEPTGYMSDRERDYCRDHGQEIADLIRCAAPQVEGLTSGEGDARKLLVDMFGRRVGYSSRMAVEAMLAFAAASPKATATASVREAYILTVAKAADYVVRFEAAVEQQKDDPSAALTYLASQAEVAVRYIKRLIALTDSGTAATIGGERAKDLAFVIAEAKRTLHVVQRTMECNADDERRWADTIQWLEGLA